MVRNVSIRGKHKLSDLLEESKYIIIEKPNEDIPVYKVKPEGSTHPIRTLHHNLLLPLDIIPSRTEFGCDELQRVSDVESITSYSEFSDSEEDSD